MEEKEYTLSDLIKYLKVVYENIFTMHHNVIGNKFFNVHEKLNEYYDKIQEYIDEIVEVADTQGIKEPSIIESINSFKGKEPILIGKPYTCDECYTNVKIYFNNIIELIDTIKDKVKSFIKSKLEEIQFWLNLEANYKIKRLLVK